MKIARRNPSMDNQNQLHELINDDEILLAPGCHDPLTAKIIELAGFDAVYMTGFGTSLAKNGLPDAGLTSRDEIVSNVNQIQERIDVPLIADAETGYGNAVNVIRTVQEYVKTDVGGFHLEDQSLYHKRCGSFKGKRVIEAREMIGKLRAANDVIQDRSGGTVLIARTDARGAQGGGLQEAIDRGNKYFEAGADLIFVAGLQNKDEVQQVGEEVEAPLLYETPLLGPRMDPETLEDFGYDVVLFPLISTQVTAWALYTYLDKLKSNGLVDTVNEVESNFDELPFNKVLDKPSGLGQIIDWEEKYLPENEVENYNETEGIDIKDL
jgi:2-methylisocitrate lyase-like PEP mutase family enzyme